MTWVFLVLAYGIIKGFREIFKKKAMEKSSTIEVLFFYTLISFLIVIPEGKNALIVEVPTLLVVALKSFTIFLAWICGFRAIKHMPVSLYGILDLSRVLFSTALGVIVIGERMRGAQIVGLILVVAGLLLLKVKKKSPESSSNVSPSVKTAVQAPDGTLKVASPKNSTAAFFILLSFISAFLNAVSGTMDKLIMRSEKISDGHLQFWYMLFLVAYYLIYILINLSLNKSPKRENKFQFQIKSSLKNYWIWILAILFVIADRCLFIANADPNSTVTVMTLIKQSCCIVTIIAGKLVFHEKNIIHKLICAAIIITGIVISILL